MRVSFSFRFIYEIQIDACILWLLGARLHLPHKTFQFHTPNFTPLVSIVHATDMEIEIGIGEAQWLSFFKRPCHILGIFIVLEEDDRKCVCITRRCEFGYMESGMACDGSVVALVG